MNKNKSAKQIATNNTLVYRKSHPLNRVSFGIPGVPGIAVFDKRLFADGKVPKAIVLDCSLAVPVAKEPKVAEADETAAATS